MTLARINPLAQLQDGSFVAVDAHMEMENEARPRQKKLLEELASATTRRASARADRVRARGRGGRRVQPSRRSGQRDRVSTATLGS